MTEAVPKPRRLRGHTATATCCIASRERPGIIVTSGEDGCICWFDLRCKEVQFIIDVGNEPVTSLCFKSGNEDIVYASSGKEVKAFDVQMGASWKALECYNYNKEEIDQIACNSKSSFLACADDGGDVKIIDTRQHCLYKTLRSGHSSICSTVQFVPWKPWDVITGGLDSKLVMWDFSRGHLLKIIDFGLPDVNNSNTGQCYNPAFVHAIAVPDVDMLDKTDKICAVARGDGVVDVLNIESELSTTRSKNSIKAQKGSQSIPKNNTLAGEMETLNLNGGKRLHLDYSLGGHTAAASCMAFSLFGEKGKYLISGGNDKSVKVWDCSRFSHTGQTGSNSNLLHMNINLNRKVNWLCTSPTESENVVVCDTSKVVKVYTIS
ncbi:WD repeat-containing protein 53 [Mangifera indica]|uniref:WD repeat-containing protein 53 n=1 Tax=Mangifera indica TaxID=29780 RepID=UPI001CFB70B2|nr:WD repeat-containing protein 53 [Mangifera indica]